MRLQLHVRAINTINTHLQISKTYIIYTVRKHKQYIMSFILLIY